MIKLKWNSDGFEIETGNNIVTIMWSEFSALQKLLGEAERLANSDLSGEIELDE